MQASREVGFVGGSK